ncbi:ferredoxin [Streptomyces violaceusniger]|uniref:Ferredoxin n=1 Tax=Streptomyces violaceusniger TaxID=68280 RepID=A0A4D4KSN8_STRVO|nr:ferredoxin [Streptomyces violaceusniger]
MRITTDTDRCVGAGQCVLAAENVFDQNDEDGRVVLLVDSPDESLGLAVRDAANLCPARAITLHKD